MISADTNLFVHAANRDSPLREACISFFQQHAGNSDFVLCELVLLELYMCLRNPAIMRKPLSSTKAVAYCEQLRSNPAWQIVDYSPDIRDALWKRAAEPKFAFRSVIDARLAFTLRFHGVNELATINTKHFSGFGFAKVWNPVA